MGTALLYFQDSYQFVATAIIQASQKDEQGYYVLLDQTIFYPQGGGQPSDTGTIEAEGRLVCITAVKNINNEIRHYTDQDCSQMVSQKVLCKIDSEKRFLHARLHSAGHLISNIIETLYPTCHGVKGHHFPGQSYVEFSIKSDGFDGVVLEAINEEVTKYIKEGCLLYLGQISVAELQNISPDINLNHIPSDQPIRTVRIGNFPFSPCGGTHVKDLTELQGLKVDRFKIKDDRMKIYYQI